MSSCQCVYVYVSVCVLTSVDDGLHGKLVASFLDVGAECGDVLLLSEGVCIRKHCFYLANMTLLKTPDRQTQTNISHCKQTIPPYCILSAKTLSPSTYLCIMS